MGEDRRSETYCGRCGFYCVTKVVDLGDGHFKEISECCNGTVYRNGVSSYSETTTSLE